MRLFLLRFEKSSVHLVRTHKHITVLLLSLNCSTVDTSVYRTVESKRSSAFLQNGQTSCTSYRCRIVVRVHVVNLLVVFVYCYT